MNNKLPYMFITCGHPGSGKTTFAKQFAEANSFRYLSIDDTYAAFNGDPTSHDNKFDVWLTFWRQIHAAEMQRCSVVIDINAPTKPDRDDFLNWFPEFDHHIIEVWALKALCRENNQRRARIIPDDQLEKIFKLFEPIDRDEMSDKRKTRSYWGSHTVIYNDRNHFTMYDTEFGTLPDDIIIPKEES